MRHPRDLDDLHDVPAGDPRGHWSPLFDFYRPGFAIVSAGKPAAE
jgi:hypothetical protein